MLALGCLHLLCEICIKGCATGAGSVLLADEGEEDTCRGSGL
jgi:hypothetical protein